MYLCGLECVVVGESCKLLIVEEIVDKYKRPLGRGYCSKVLVCWLSHRELTWEPRVNFEVAEALDIWEQYIAAGEVMPTGRLERKGRRRKGRLM